LRLNYSPKRFRPIYKSTRYHMEGGSDLLGVYLSFVPDIVFHLYRKFEHYEYIYNFVGGGNLHTNTMQFSQKYLVLFQL
jgi:hypothetical protein